MHSCNLTGNFAKCASKFEELFGSICQRFTENAEDVIARLEDEKTPLEEEHDKQVMKTLSEIALPQVLIRKLKRWSHISACGFFTVDRSLVTAFLATTFTYWVILVQFTQTANS